MRVNPTWQAEMRAKIQELLSSRGSEYQPVISITTAHNVSAQWLVAEFFRNNIPYKVTNLGAGVKHVTTDTDNCPFCKRKLK